MNRREFLIGLGAALGTSRGLFAARAAELLARPGVSRASGRFMDSRFSRLLIDPFKRMNGIRMEVWTDFPAIQIYTGISMAAPYKNNQGIAIEPEAYPDSPNHSEFPTTTLRPGETYNTTTIYKFGTK